MDYDDEDISRHNLQLTGEGRTRTSSLRPYDFPKFDFDVNLQGQLRFDSLVETEVFLGIQSQEDNQWIEDFSRGSNGMEFNPNPADSCAISRRDNVWSEATSSESVEMLLKSVGQEELAPAVNIMPEATASDNQLTATQRGELDTKMDERNDVHIPNSDAKLPQIEAVEDHPAPERSMEEQLPLDVGPSLIPEKVASLCEISHTSTQDALGGKGGSSTIEGKLLHHGEPADGNLEEPKTSDEKNVSCEAAGDSLSTSIDDSKGSDVALPSSSESSKQGGAGPELVSSNKDGQGTHVSTGIGQEDSAVSDGKAGESTILVSAAHSNPCLVTVPGGVNTQGADEPHSKCDRDSTKMAVETESETKLSEGDGSGASLTNPVQTDNCNVDAVAVNSDMGDPSESSTDGQKQHVAMLGSSEAVHCTGLGPKTDSSVQLTQRDNFGKVDDVPPNEDLIKNVSETPPFSMEDDKVPLDRGDDNRADEGTKDDRLNILQHYFDKIESGNDVAPHAESNASAGADDKTENEQRKAAAIGVSYSDSDHQNDLSARSSDGYIGTEEGAVTEVQVDAAAESAKSPLCEVVLKSQLYQEKFNDASSSWFPSIATTDSLQLDNPKNVLGGEKSSLKGSCSADIASVEDPEVAMLKSDENLEPAQATDLDKASCGSPTIISSSEPSQMEKDDQEEARESLVADKFVNSCQPTSEDVKGKDSLGDDGSFTFKVNTLPDLTEEQGKNWSPFPDVEKCNSRNLVKESTATGKAKTERMSSPKTLHQSSQTFTVESVHEPVKSTSERKGRRASGRGTAKESSKKGSQGKGANQEITTGKVDKGSKILSNAPSSNPHVQFRQTQSFANIESSNTKLAVAGIAPTSNISDLTASPLHKSTSSSPAFRQPFTDLQQVQLRAQIFVYGSLIQGTAPDEACMVSAFGSSGAGRTTWETIWRAAVDRARNQKSSSSAAETPLRLQSGARASDAAVKQSSHSSKMLATPVSKTSNKDAPAKNANPIIPLSSPLWSVSTPSHDNLPSSAMHRGSIMDFQSTTTPLHSFQTPPIRNFAGHTSWTSQSCYPGPWLASPQTTTFSSSVRFEPVTMTETVKLTPVKDTGLPPASSMKHMTPSPVAPSMAPNPVFGGVSSLHDPKTKSSPELHSVDSKPRKRKKVQASDPGQFSLVSEAQTGHMLIPNEVALQSAPVGLQALTSASPDAIPSKPASGAAVTTVDRFKNSEVDVGKSVACSEETLRDVAVAKTQAEDAADLAATAVRHCEDLWGKLAEQKESGLTSEGESNLASAAAAIAAAASVAKAAAAAAKIACNAALRAKLLADETFLSSKTATPLSILKGDKVSNPSKSILVAAKEAAKRRVEAASAASKQAENLDAIVKAAELAAAAVSQAGKIVAMGEPLPLNDLIEAGPEGYWKLPQSRSDFAEEVGDGNKGKPSTNILKEDGKFPVNDSGKKSLEREGTRRVGHGKINQTERKKDSIVGRTSLADDLMVPMNSHEMEFSSERDCEAANIAVSSRLVSESDVTQTTNNVQNEQADDSIKEGSPVEVFKCGDNLKSAWYSASVLSLEGGKAHVCYSDLSSEEGSGNLREWIPLDASRDKAPIIRTAHPLSALQYQGTRKRRRAALGDYSWCVGDRVDVWIDDCWWEGVVTEKNEKDETSLKVHFPANGETSTVRAWNLRTSRTWIDGKWVECASVKGINPSDQSDIPQEKRQKLGSPAVATKGIDNLPNDTDLASGKPEELKVLALLTSERTFDMGKATLKDNKHPARRPLRAGQQKEGSRVVFGVPKPTGKKRKFMEVSKHFPANKGGKNNEGGESDKFAKYLMPQRTGSRGWKAPLGNVSREKRKVEPGPRVPSTHKTYRSLPQRDYRESSHETDNGTDHGSDVEDSVVHGDNASEKMIDPGFSADDELAEAPLSSLLPHTLGASSRKTSSTSSRPERLTRGRLAPSGRKLTRIEEDRVFTAHSGKSVTDANEPRRSNRRIQPTHRLLEGLQSSMVIPKMPSVSHDKDHRIQSRNVSARGK